MYEYLVWGLLGLAIWGVLYWRVPRIRRILLFGSLTYAFFPIAGTILWNLLFFLADFGPRFVPAYWDPPMLFDWGRTLGLSLEDVLFLFVMGGFVSASYELVTRSTLRPKKQQHLHTDVFVVLTVAFFAIALSRMNPIYTMFLATIIAAAYLLVRRPDLLKHALGAGLISTVLYALYFWFALLVFPHFVSYWNLAGLSGIVLLGIPLEEYAYAFTLGLLWGPLYEYVRHAKVK